MYRLNVLNGVVTDIFERWAVFWPGFFLVVGCFKRSMEASISFRLSSALPMSLTAPFRAFLMAFTAFSCLSISRIFALAGRGRAPCSLSSWSHWL